jgi:hypothetical protein
MFTNILDFKTMSTASVKRKRTFGEKVWGKMFSSKKVKRAIQERNEQPQTSTNNIRNQQQTPPTTEDTSNQQQSPTTTDTNNQQQPTTSRNKSPCVPASQVQVQTSLRYLLVFGKNYQASSAS